MFQDNFMNQGGGGFLPQNDNQAPGNELGNAGGDKQHELKNIVEMSLDQIRKLSYQDQGILLHRQKVHILSTIGFVKEMLIQTTKHTYKIVDETGMPVEVQSWVGNDKSLVANPNITEGIMIRVFGQVRWNGAQMFIMAFKVVPVKDANEITTHALGVLYHSMVFFKRKGLVPGQGLGPAIPGQQGQKITTNPADTKESIDDKKTKMIIDYITQNGTGQEGIHISKVISGLRRQLDEATIKNKILYLANEAHVYTTDDNGEYYKSIDS